MFPGSPTSGHVNFYGAGETLGTGPGTPKPPETLRNLNITIVTQLIDVVGTLTAWRIVLVLGSQKLLFDTMLPTVTMKFKDLRAVDPSQRCPQNRPFELRLTSLPKNLRVSASHLKCADAPSFRIQTPYLPTYVRQSGYKHKLCVIIKRSGCAR